MIRTPGMATRVGARDLRTQPQHRFGWARRVIRTRCGLDAGVEEVTHGKHVPEAFITIKMHLLAMEEHVAGKGQRDHTGSLDTADELGRDERAVLDPQARIAPRELALQLLVDTEARVDRHIPIRVRADLPAGEVSLAGLVIQGRARSAADPPKIPEAGVRLGQQRGTLGY